jgi:DNA-binding NarL/FixJ family response regulator
VRKIRILLADDHAILREGLRSMLRYCDDMQVVGDARNGDEALARVDELRPDIVVMDIAMPGTNGIEATRLIRERYPQTEVLVLSQHVEAQYVLSMVRAGARGYVPKEAVGAEFIAALRALGSGKAFFHPSVATAALEEVGEASDVLTPRERQVLRLIVDGQTSAQIAESLSLSVNTVVWHRANLMSKADVHNVAELVNYAYQRGLMDVGD